MKKYYDKFTHQFRNGNRIKIFNGLVFATIFTIIGVLVPFSYYRYADPKQYIQFVEPVTFDRKIYAPCDTAKALLKVDIKIDSEVRLISRMMRVEESVDGNPHFEVVATRQSTNLAKAVPETQTFTSNYHVPCDLPDGIYFFRGDISYKVKGVEKHYTFDTAQITVDKDTEVKFRHNHNIDDWKNANN